MIERKVKNVRALERGLDVLMEIRRCRAISLHELHQNLGLPKATLLRMLVTLSQRGLIWQRLADGAFLPSSLSDPVSLCPDATALLAEVASPMLAKLSHQVAWPSVIAVPRLDHVEIIETNSSMTRLDSAALGPVGVKLSYLHTATGRAYLAACDPTERAAIIRRLSPPDATEASFRLLDRIVADTLARGYAERDPAFPWPHRNRAEVASDGRRSIAVAIRVNERPVAAVNITWPAHRMHMKDILQRHLPTLQATAASIGTTVEASRDRFVM